MKARISILAVLLALLNSGFVVAQHHLLSLSSKDAQLELSLNHLDKLEQVSFTTSTIWTDGEVQFSGVPLSVVLNAADAKGSLLRMVALNDYAVEMPMDEIGQTSPIVATRMNGEPMTVRGKGPFWIVYPYDLDPQFRTEAVFARSIWQLRKLSIKD
ncbi:MAG: molybdopterin-dependent oxidoreductase [Pseudomonadota bacterium]